MSAQVLVLEQFTLTAPFGLRFWDVAAAAPADGGLSVVAYPDRFPELRIVATEGPSGVYSFSGLPGLREAENSAGDDAFWAANPPSLPYTVVVSDGAPAGVPSRDPRGQSPSGLRYLSFQLSVSLPVRGLFALWDSPLSGGLTPGPDWLPIFSSPSRVLPGPAGLISATLLDDSLNKPAAWALVTVQAPGLPAVSALADDRGVVSLFQPYPEPSGAVMESPLRAPNLTSQSWPVTVSVYYSALQAQGGMPDLDQVLRQNAASVWRDATHTSLLDTFQLNYGTELVLRSFDSNSGRELPVLLISPTSPL